MPRLSDDQIDQLEHLMVAAFPSVHQLDGLLQFLLDRRLAWIRIGGSMVEYAHAIVVTAEREGWVQDLLRGIADVTAEDEEGWYQLIVTDIAEERPYLTPLQTWIRPILKEIESSSHHSLRRLDEQKRERLQQMLLDAFDANALDELLQFELDTRCKNVSTANNLRDVIRDVIQSAETGGWIVNLLEAVAQERPLRADIQALVLALMAYLRSPEPPPAPPPLPTVFLGHANEDSESAFMNRLRQQLEILVQPEQIEFWDDKSRGVSVQWKRARQDALDRATIVLLLISADYLSSEYVRDEMLPRLEKRHTEGLPVIPVVVKSSNYKKAIPWLAGIPQRPIGDAALQSLTEAQADAALSDLAGEVADILARADAQS